MNFKAAYCGLTLALVIAACGPGPEVTKATTAEEAAEAVTSSQMNMAAAMGAAMGGNANNPTMTAYSKNLGTIADAMAMVKDEASARAAAQKIAGANAELEKLADQFDKMSDREKAASAMAIAPELMVVQQKIAAATMSIMSTDPKLMEIVSDELAKMPDLN